MTDVINVGSMENDEGGAGTNGWSPLFAVVEDGERRVLQLTDWTGGTGTKPEGVGKYLGPDGLVDAIADATNIRGAAGSSGGNIPAANITEDAEHRFTTDEQQAEWDGKATADTSALGINLLNPDTVVLKKRLDPVTFVVVDSTTDYRLSDYIPVKALTRYFITGMSAVRNATPVAFYDTDKALLGGYNDGKIDEPAIQFTTVANTAFIRFTVKTGKDGDDTDPAAVQVSEALAPGQFFPFSAPGVSQVDETELIANIGGADPVSPNHNIPRWYLEKNFGKNRLAGKKVLIFGDSITEDTHAGQAAPDRVSWVTYFREETGAFTYNFARSGASFTDWAYTTDARQQLSKQITDAIDSGVTPDIIVIAIGTNDIFRESVLGDYNTVVGKAVADLDRTVVLEAARDAFYRLTSQFPGIPVFYGTPLQRVQNAGSQPGMAWLRGPLTKMARRYDVKVIDAWAESGIVSDFEVLDGAGRYLADGLHPNDTGYRMLGKFYAAKIAEGGSDSGGESYDDTAIKASIAALQGSKADITALSAFAPKKQVGAVYDKSAWTDLSDFAVNSLGATVVDGKISIPNAGVVDFSKSLQLAKYSCVNHWKMILEFQLTVDPAAATTGISVGIQSTNADSRNSWGNYFRMSTTDNTGRMQFFGQSNGGSWTSISNAASNLTFAKNDLIRLSLERSNDKVILRAENLTNPVAQVEFATTAPFNGNPIAPNTGHFTIFGQGGACTISRITVINKELSGPNTLFLGDSKTFGYGASSLKTTYPGILGSLYSDICISAGFGDKTQDILNRIDEILLLKPKTVVLSIGSNDLRFGVDDATFKANYQSIVDQLTAIGARVIHLSPSYEQELDLTDQYNWMKENFSPFIDVFYLMSQSGNLYSDHIHWSTTGNKYAANAIVDSGLLEGRITTNEYL